MSGLATVLIIVGFFLLGGVYSFTKQKQPRSVVVLLAIGSAMCLGAGFMRLDMWS
ncbi:MULTISPECIES: hypothetical protein [Streptomyces]|uniref:hypothetical protein n=1 Tax=Streptomyces TaxID=1883 RepID=UPI00129727DF|nr:MULTISPECIES: hypothetical protein [Streptomyces]